MTDYKTEEKKHYDKKANYNPASKLSYSDFVLRKSAEFYYEQIKVRLSL
jgi:hypothetical protein